MALWLVPLHLFPLTLRPQYPVDSFMSYPGAPQSVQTVTGLGRFSMSNPRGLESPGR